jgi:GT2 family glycosyltransferase
VLRITSVTTFTCEGQYLSSAIEMDPKQQVTSREKSKEDIGLGQEILISVVVVSWNTCHVLRDCLYSMYRQEIECTFEVIVVDNGSSDGSVSMLEKEFPSVTLIRNSKNLGFAAANNQAFKISRGRYVLLLNSDTVLVERKSLHAFVDFLDSHPEAGAVGGTLLNPDGTLQVYCRRFTGILNQVLPLVPGVQKLRSLRLPQMDMLPDEFDYNKIGEIDYGSGAFLCLRKRALEDVGYLDEEFFMYSEEEDWCYRAKRKGWRVFYMPGASVVHFQGASAVKMGKASLEQLFASKFMLLKKHRGKIYAEFYRVIMILVLGLSIFLGSIFMLFFSHRLQGERISQKMTYRRSVLRICLKGFNEKQPIRRTSLGSDAPESQSYS